MGLASIEKVNPPTPNEKLIYYHIHQASKWAELYYTNKTVHAPLEMGIHLGKVKFSEEHLVYSHFYQEFILLYSLIHDFSKSSLGSIQELRAKIAVKAKGLNVPLAKNWKTEFHFLESN